MKKLLTGKVALVAGATRGAGRGIAVQLGAAGAIVYVTGRTTRSQRSEMNRPETIADHSAQSENHAQPHQRLVRQSRPRSLPDLPAAPSRLTPSRRTPYRAEAALLFLCVNTSEVRSLLSIKRATQFLDLTRPCAARHL
jgi:NAD(P)-dependent dehydrogenase (short-subunit alcohol dehydrogenase family)